GDGRRDLRGGARAVDGWRIPEYRQRRHPSREGRQHIRERGGPRRGDDSDRARVSWQVAFARRGGPARGIETRLQSDELLGQGPETGDARRLDIELELAARLVNRRNRPDLDVLPVLQSEAQKLRL